MINEKSLSEILLPMPINFYEHDVSNYNDDIMIWKHLPPLPTIYEGNLSVTSRFPSQKTIIEQLWYFFVISLNKQLNNRQATGDTRCNNAHVTSL